MAKSFQLAGFALLLGSVAFAVPAKAFKGRISGPPTTPCGATCCYVVPSLEDSGDFFYGPSNWDWCRQNFLNNFVDGWGLDGDNWDGHGWNEACNMERPFARMLVARLALHTAHPNPPSSTKDWSGPMLRWAFGWSWERLDDTRVSCFHNRFDAYSSSGKVTGFIVDSSPGSTMMRFFHRLNVAERAALMLHEARHINFGKHKGSNSRDRNFDENGPYRYQAQWLLEYAASANRDTTTKALRCAAQDAANGIMFGDAPPEWGGGGWAFVTRPDPSLQANNAECR